MFTENISAFFADFAGDAQLGGQAVRGIFDNAYALGAVGVGMASTRPTFTLATAMVAGEPVGQALVYAGRTWLVAEHEPDGTGLSRLYLEAVA